MRRGGVSSERGPHGGDDGVGPVALHDVPGPRDFVRTASGIVSASRRAHAPNTGSLSLPAGTVTGTRIAARRPRPERARPRGVEGWDAADEPEARAARARDRIAAPAARRSAAQLP